MPKAVAKGDCDDSHDQCPEWAYFGECEKNPGFMNVTCKKSCKVCVHGGGSAEKAATLSVTSTA